jgi:hypothetical protein
METAATPMKLRLEFASSGDVQRFVFRPQFHARRPGVPPILPVNTGGRYRESKSVRVVRSAKSLLGVSAAAMALACWAQPAAAGLEEALKALQAGDVQTTEKELQVLAKERDPRAQFILGLYVYGNPESKLYDVNKATPMLLDASERGYLPAIMPVAGAYAEGKGVPKSGPEAYKWLLIAERWNVPNANLAVEQAARDLKPDEIEKAKAAATAYTFKIK